MIGRVPISEFWRFNETLGQNGVQIFPEYTFIIIAL